MDHRSPYRIRSARFDELHQLAAIEQAAGMRFATTAHADLCLGANLPLEVVSARWRTGFVFVAVDRDRQIVGFALGGELDGQGFLQEIDVLPAHGRRGLGRRLIRAARLWARRHGYTSLLLSTFADVAWNAPLYARLGFEVVALDDLTPALREIRAAESRAGFLIASRVLMRARL